MKSIFLLLSRKRICEYIYIYIYIYIHISDFRSLRMKNKQVKELKLFCLEVCLLGFKSPL